MPQCNLKAYSFGRVLYVCWVLSSGLYLAQCYEYNTLYDQELTEQTADKIVSYNLLHICSYFQAVIQHFVIKAFFGKKLIQRSELQKAFSCSAQHFVLILYDQELTEQTADKIVSYNLLHICSYFQAVIQHFVIKAFFGKKLIQRSELQRAFSCSAQHLVLILYFSKQSIYGLMCLFSNVMIYNLS